MSQFRMLDPTIQFREGDVHDAGHCDHCKENKP